jgi:hypothetical protein
MSTMARGLAPYGDTAIHGLALPVTAAARQILFEMRLPALAS